MKETLKKWRDTLLEKVPRKNDTPEQKAARTKKAIAAGIVVGILAVLLLTAALFPVLSIEIEDNQSHYTKEELIEALDKSSWTPLLNLTPRRAEQRLMASLLYLDSASVKYEFPATLCLSVSEQKPLYYFYYDTQINGKNQKGWLAVGPDLRLVDAAGDPQRFAELGLTRIALPAPVLDKTAPGRASKLCFTREEDTGENAKTEQDYAYISEFLTYLEDAFPAEKLTSVDLREKFDVRVTLESKYRIDFGRVRDRRDFEQKLALAEKILASDAASDPDQRYIISVGTEIPSSRPVGEMDLDLTEE